MSKTLKSLAIAGAIACLAAFSPARAQTAPGEPPLEPPALAQPPLDSPRIYDAAGRMVGVVLAPQPPDFLDGYGKVLLTFAKGEAVMRIGPSGLGTISTPGVSGPIYYSKPDCSGPAFMAVRDFPPFGKFTATGPAQNGFTAAATIQYPSRPYTTIDLIASPTEGGGCYIMSSPLRSQLAGVVATARLDPYKLPFSAR